MVRSRCKVFMLGFWAALIAFAVPGPARADSFTIENWGFGVSVYRAWPDFADDGFVTVLNPFIATHQVTLPSNPATFAAAQYDISWLVNYGSFNISAQLAAQDGSSVRSLASGTVYLQADADLILTLDLALTYNLPTYGLYASLGFSVRDLTANEYLFGTNEMYDSVTGPPGTGVLTITSNVLLPASHQFRVQYWHQLNTFGDSVGVAAAAGYTNWTLASIPEPATLALLAPLPLVLMRRRVRWVVGGRRTQAA